VFTGALYVIGVLLLAYRLTSWAIDNFATTLAGISALGVAFFHAAPKNATLTQLRLSDVHLTCATVLTSFSARFRCSSFRVTSCRTRGGAQTGTWASAR
jgi:hypothetical protein